MDPRTTGRPSLEQAAGVGVAVNRAGQRYLYLRRIFHRILPFQKVVNHMRYIRAGDDVGISGSWISVRSCFPAGDPQVPQYFLISIYGTVAGFADIRDDWL